MKVIVDIYHPAHVHQFKNIITHLQGKGDCIKILTLDKDVTISLLEYNNLKYDVLMVKNNKKGFVKKCLTGAELFIKIFTHSTSYKPDLYIGRPNIMSSLCSFLLRKPHITYDDDDIDATKWIHLVSSKILKTTIITPDNYSHNYGENHIFVNGYKELFYLHPDVYVPSTEVINTYNLPQDGYIIVRFVAWKAFHDVNQHGITNKAELVQKLSSLKKVIIVSEGELDPELKPYQMRAPPEAFHDILANAALLVGDSQTVTAEAAMLGVPAIRCNSWVGENDAGGLKELDEKYHLIYNIADESKILPLAEELLNTPNLREIWKAKRDIMLKEKVNMTEYFIKLIEDTYNKK